MGPDYLVMEYVEGKPLAGPLPAAEAVRLAGQIADALEHAHQKGIVHRDLKPSNILVTKTGVKVLDFGLAQRVPAHAPDETSETLTEEGALAGTPRYMAPEQIDGKRADQRTDVFAFGLVLYELLTGQRAFDGKSAPSVMAAILAKEPTPIAALQPDVPPALAQLVTTCLAKDPADRWQSVRELKHALGWALGPQAPPARGSRRWAWAAVAAAILLVVVAGAVLALRRPAKPARAQPVRLFVNLPPKTLFVGKPVVSPDGKGVAFEALLHGGPHRIFVRSLDALVAREVSGAERSLEPFWSPDSAHVAFWDVWGGLRRVDRAGGSAVNLCEKCRTGGGGGLGHGSTWGSTGVIVFSDSGRLFRLPPGATEAEPLGALVPGETGRFWPQFLPDGTHYIYLSLSSRREDQGIYAGALGSELRKRIVAAEHAAAYSPPGYLLYVKGGALVAQPFDTTRLELSGEPQPILDEEVARATGTVSGGPASFSVSANGVLAWSPALPELKQMTWFDRAGQKLGTVGEPGPYFGPYLSPDEKTVAVSRVESAANRDIWLIDTASGASRRLTFDPHDEAGPTWSPDGKRIIFFSDRRGVREIYQRAADGTGAEELLLASTDFGLHPEDWSADGRFLSYNSAKPGGSHDLFVLPLSKEGPAVPIPFLATPAMESASVISPNGRYMAYHSNESGTMQVYVRELTPEGRAGPGKWQVSKPRPFAAWPRWRSDGRELFYAAGPAARSQPSTS